MDLNLFTQDITKICLLIAFQQSLSSGQKTANFHRYWQILVKNLCHFMAGNLKAFFSFFLLCFSSHWPNNFCLCKFFAKGLESEGKRLKVKFWSSEMIKIGRGQHNYHRCRRRHCLQSFEMMIITVNQISNWTLRNSKKNLPPSCSRSLFIHIFNFILDAPRRFFNLLRSKIKDIQVLKYTVVQLTSSVMAKLNA